MSYFPIIRKKLDELERLHPDEQWTILVNPAEWDALAKDQDKLSGYRVNADHYVAAGCVEIAAETRLIPPTIINPGQ